MSITRLFQKDSIQKAGYSCEQSSIYFFSKFTWKK